MDIRGRHIGPISRPIGDTEAVEVDAGALIRRLILFEHCIIESNRLKEIPSLLRVFGLGGFKALLESKALSIVCDELRAGSIGQHEALQVTIRRGGPLPLGSYRIVPILVPEREKYLHYALESVHNLPGVTLKEEIRLRNQLVPLLGAYPPEVAINSRASFLQRIEHSGWSVNPALEVAFYGAMGTELPRGIYIETEDFGNDGDFRVSTNLISRTGLSTEEAHMIIERALLGVAGLEQRLEIMKSFSSLSGFRDIEIPVFEQRLQFLGEQLDPSAQEKRFDRIVAVAGLPELDGLPEGQRIDAERLLELRDSAECREFRTWLREIDTDSDQEIEARFFSMRESVARVTNTRTAKIIRFIIEEGVGDIPIIGIAAGPVFAGVDKFILDKLIGRPGPVSFIGKKYPSIFKGAEVSLSELMGDGESGEGSS